MGRFQSGRDDMSTQTARLLLKLLEGRQDPRGKMRAPNVAPASRRGALGQPEQATGPIKPKPAPTGLPNKNVTEQRKDDLRNLRATIKRRPPHEKVFKRGGGTLG